MSAAATLALPVPQVRASASNAKWLIAIAVSLGALLEIIDTSIVNVALSDIQASLSTTLTQVSWVVSGYGIANVIILPLSAWLGDRFGKKSYFLFSLVGFTVASMLCGMATTFPMLVIARVLQGLTGGGLLAKAQAILFETFPKDEQAMAQGLFGSIVIAGPAIGPTLGGYIVTNIGWRWIFFVNLPFGILAMLMVLAFLPKDEARSAAARARPVDWTGILLLAVGIGSLQTLLEEGEQDLWFESPFIVTLAVVAAVGLVTFVVHELRTRAPVVDLRVLRYRSLWAGSILSTVIGMVLYGSLFAIPIFASSILHYTSQQVGMLLLPSALASAVAMPIAAKLVGRFDARALIVIGAVTLLVSMRLFSTLSPQTGGDDLFWPNIVRGFGTVLMFMPLQLAALGSIPKQDVAAATGFFNLTRQLGGSVGVALLTTLLDQREAFHRAVLAEKIVPSEPHTLERIAAYTQAMLARGFPMEEAKQKALALLDGAVNLQSAVLSFSDTFWATAALIFCALPLVLLLGKPAKSANAMPAH
jgi:MFS transporter, DHA2 family, multidrug resistance protein